MSSDSDFRLALAYAGVSEAEAREAERKAAEAFSDRGETMRERVERLRRDDDLPYPVPRR